jgi:3'-phosphoadenosine 5'-phosphosulfate sulfotransferase (PAPS reductase)/FAD synthetase
MVITIMADLVHDAERLKELQALPLERKIQITQARIIEWYQHYDGAVCVSFSGGKDSTVLLHIARNLYPNIKAVYSNTGLEYPEIQRFVRSFDNVDIVTPKMRFDEVVSTYGYPIISKEVGEAIWASRKINPARRRETDHQRESLLGKRKHGNERSMYNKEKWLPLAYQMPFIVSKECCAKMKKQPMNSYKNKNHYKLIIATLTEESLMRKQSWIAHGCNSFDSKNPKSQPLSFWTEQDILTYIVKYDLKIADVYGEIVSICGNDEYPPKDVMGNVNCNLKCTGCQRTGCIFCGFGFHLEKGKTRFQALAETHPRQYEYAIQGGAMGE